LQRHRPSRPVQLDGVLVLFADPAQPSCSAGVGLQFGLGLVLSVPFQTLRECLHDCLGWRGRPKGLVVRRGDVGLVLRHLDRIVTAELTLAAGAAAASAGAAVVEGQ